MVLHFYSYIEDVLVENLNHAASYAQIFHGMDQLFSNSMFPYDNILSTQVKSSVTVSGRVFDKDILNASHIMAYVRVETAVVICRSGIWSLSLS